MSEPPARVKLFFLDANGQWEEKGICRAEISEGSIELVSETSNLSVLNCLIESISPYRQSDTILCWADDKDKNYALSFQHVEDADFCWTRFSEILGPEKIDNTHLPEPFPANIEKIMNLLAVEGNIRLVSYDWVNDLNNNAIANCNNREIMQKYFSVYKELLNCLKFDVYEGLLLSENFVAVFKVLEFDSEKSFTNNFSGYFDGPVRFNNVLQISDAKLLEKVHLAHRILCLKEAMMSKSFKEVTIQVLWNFHMSLWSEILGLFVDLAEQRANLMAKVMENDLNAFLFLEEALHYSKFMSPSTRTAFYEALDSDGVLKLMQKNYLIESSNAKKIKRIVIDTFYSISLLSPKLLMESFNRDSESRYVFIFQDCISCEMEVLQKSMDVLKMLLLPQFIAFYSRFVKDFYEKVLTNYVAKIKRCEFVEDYVERINEVLLLIAHCLANDNALIRCFFIENDFISELKLLVKNSHSQIKIACIKVLKSLLSRKESVLINLLIKSDIIKTLLRQCAKNAATENLLFSSIFSFFVESKRVDFKALTDCILTFLKTNPSLAISNIFTVDIQLPQIELKRSRTISIDLTATEKYCELDMDYNEFNCFDASQDRSDEADVVLGKRNSDTFKSPVKKINRNIE
jgi:hypothetical protein